MTNQAQHPDRFTRVRARVVARVALLAALAILGGALIACSGGDDEDIVVSTPTATPTATRTPTPSPTPTPTPVPWPIPAAKIPLGETAAPGLVNATSIGFPLPPQVVRHNAERPGGMVRMFAPGMGIDHYIETVGITNGVMDTPVDAQYAVGWYAPTDVYDFGTPGKEGNLIFSAHETWSHMQGPFYNVHKARIGEDIFIEMENGEVRHYQVHSLERFHVSEIPMREVLWPSDRPEAEEWLTIYTCGGEIIYGPNGYGDYLARDVLIAKWVGYASPSGEPLEEAAQQAIHAEAGDAPGGDSTEE